LAYTLPFDAPPHCLGTPVVGALSKEKKEDEIHEVFFFNVLQYRKKIKSIIKFVKKVLKCLKIRNVLIMRICLVAVGPYCEDARGCRGGVCPPLVHTNPSSVAVAHPSNVHSTTTTLAPSQ
jgi:hypothetical protein